MLHMMLLTNATHFSRALYLLALFSFSLSFSLSMSHTNATTQSLRHHTSLSSPLSITDTPKETIKQTRLYLLTRQPLTARNLEMHTSMVRQVVVIDCIMMPFL